MEQNGRTTDHLIISMNEKLTKLSNNNHRDPFIYRVYDRIRRQNERAYEPELLAIGPYNHGKPALQVMEEHKYLYLQLLLRRRGESSVHRYVTAVRTLEEEARGCYADDIGLRDSNQFVEMLVLDGCFIVELCRKFENRNIRNGGCPKVEDEHDVLFKRDYLHHWMWRDMLLFENQIPFFVLNHLFEMTHDGCGNGKTMVNLLLFYYSETRKYYHYHTKSSGNNDWLEQASRGIDSGNVKHILGLIHFLTTRSFGKKLSSNQLDEEMRWEFIHSTTELREAGIWFRAKHDSCLFDITFANGMLEIPLITVDDKTECLLRNIIAYEQSLGNSDSKIVTDYMTFLYCIIKSAKDVSLLRRYGIINNMLGDDEAVSNAYSNTSSCVFVSHDRFCYKDVFKEVNAHAKRRRNIWVVKLRRNYFNSPWAIMSVLAALLLLMLTFLQTLIAFLPYLAHLHSLVT